MSQPTKLEIELLRSALERVLRATLPEHPDTLTYLEHVRTELTVVLQRTSSNGQGTVFDLTFRAALAASIASVLDTLEAETRGGSGSPLSPA